MDKIKIGARIKYFRELNNISQSDLAHSIGIDRTTLSHYESGFRLPNIFVLWKIADVMGISIDELVGRK